MQRLTWIPLVLVLAALLVGLPGNAQAAKGGGKPGGGGDPAGPPDLAFTIFDGAWTLTGLATDGSGTTTLVSSVSDGIPADPSWAPDGSRLVFRGDLQGTGLYVCDADGTNVTKIHPGPAYDPQWSPASAPDGNEWILFANGETQGDLYVVRPDGTASQPLTSTANRSEYYSCWSPDATQLAIGANDQGGVLPRKIVIVDLAVVSGQLALAAETEWTLVDESDDLFDFSWLDWSRGGDRIAFSGAETNDGERDVFTVDVSTRAIVNVTRNLSGSCRWPTWSPDDARIAFHRSGKGKTGTGIQILASSGAGTPAYLGNKDARSLDWMRVEPGSP